jgi:hypothetical protein
MHDRAGRISSAIGSQVIEGVAICVDEIAAALDPADDEGEDVGSEPEPV